MPGNKPRKTPKFDQNSAVHQPFSWLVDAAKTYPQANFLALVLDIAMASIPAWILSTQVIWNAYRTRMWSPERK